VSRMSRDMKRNEFILTVTHVIDSASLGNHVQH
jgi:hypothetical protein